MLITHPSDGVAQEHGKEVPLLLLLLYGKIEERKDSVVYVQSIGSPTPGEWKTALAVSSCKSRSCSTWDTSALALIHP
jgi:hypothetical protein